MPSIRSLGRRIKGVLWRDAAEVRALRRALSKAVDRLEQLEARLPKTEASAERAERATRRIELERSLNTNQQEQLTRLPAVLDETRIADHVRRAIEAAPMRTSPCDHIIIDELLPPDVYELLLDAIPPEVFFENRDRIKQNLVFPLADGPELTLRAWGFMDGVVAGRVIREAIIKKFYEPLQVHFDTIFGADVRQQANDLPYFGDGGRLMLRRPGYHLRPHRDPKRTMLTCLLYLAMPGDSEAYGTQLFAVSEDTESRYKQTYYPEGDGLGCKLDVTVPFRPNTMLVLLNARGAHGATIPADAPTDVERYAYQFYVAPQNAALSALVKTLPRDRRAMWKSRDLPAGWWKSKDAQTRDGKTRRTTAIT
jgi:hypothetical protein